MKNLNCIFPAGVERWVRDKIFIFWKVLHTFEILSNARKIFLLHTRFFLIRNWTCYKIVIFCNNLAIFSSVVNALFLFFFVKINIFIQSLNARLIFFVCVTKIFSQALKEYIFFDKKVHFYQIFKDLSTLVYFLKSVL